ncbi:UDP-glucose 4-epimerase GalE [Ovoidimarina sediminis]|uniref:UDP-glucose 4-epimerase GalE n=1 Tax=Ovoidimarina sediminis TaxID=3079856 RepID=UPI00290C6936|nr:UDP-glucose 4-epimerase GalE [Rhodophyticola sp. MJ-SS7]MDU8942062.1 UDP-glucose 4-epimerase GalE [Rhodophyticola sp. MJ-SS7]
MTILVTGGAGYIGSHMAWALADRGIPFLVLDTLERGFRELVPPAAVFVEGDAGDTALVARLIEEHGIREVVHFAGLIVVSESVEHPDLYRERNTEVSRRLIETAAASGVERFIFSSTASVYGMAGLGPLTETLECHPVNPYAQTKLDTEGTLTEVAEDSPMRFGILRYFNVVGADPKGRTGHTTKTATHLIKVACQAALGQRDGITVFGTDYPTPDGTCIRDYIHVCDLVEAHLALLEDLRAGGESGILNCGYGSGYSVWEVIEAVKTVSGVDFHVQTGPRREGDPASLVADVGRMRARLGWVPPPRPLADVVRSAYDWDVKLAAGRV